MAENSEGVTLEKQHIGRSGSPQLESQASAIWRIPTHELVVQATVAQNNCARQSDKQEPSDAESIPSLYLGERALLSKPNAYYLSKQIKRWSLISNLYT